MKCSLVFRGGIRTEKSTLVFTIAGYFVSLCLSFPSPSPLPGTGMDHPCSRSSREGASFMWLETHEGPAWAPSPHTDTPPKPPAKPLCCKSPPGPTADFFARLPRFPRTPIKGDVTEHVGHRRGRMSDQGAQQRCQLGAPPTAANSTKELRMSREDFLVPHDAQKATEMTTNPPRSSPAPPPLLHSLPMEWKGDGEQFPFGSWLKPDSSCLFALSWGMMEVGKVAARQGNRVSP